MDEARAFAKPVEFGRGMLGHDLSNKGEGEGCETPRGG
jgi:hypothetical protein